MKIKIMFYINALLNGGAERVMCNLANQFSERGYRVVFVTSFSKDDAYVLNTTIKRCNLETKESTDSTFKKNISRTKGLIKAIKAEKPNVIISFLPEPNFRTIIASNISHVPCIISVRSDPAREYKPKNYFWAQKILYPLAGGIVFQTKDARQWFPKRIQQKSRIIMNQVDSKFFNTDHISDAYYVAIGRLDESKNFSMLIKSFGEFSKVYPENKLLIYGKGQEETKLKNLIGELGLNEKVILMGQTDNVPKALSKAKVFILSSDYEGMPNALLEAMSVGVPVISTDCPCGGPKMIIQDNENGLLVPVNDEKAMTDAMLKIEGSDELREKFKLNSKKTAETFHPDVIFAQWEEYILKCVQG